MSKNTHDDILYLVMPAYNEEANIEKAVRGWYRVVESHGGGGLSRLLVIDDGSVDGTYGILKRLEKEMPLLKSVTKPNSGHGATVLYGYRMAIAEGADYIFQTDSDGQTNPDEFHIAWHVREKYDAVIGNRFMRGDGLARAFVEKVLCMILKSVFGIKQPLPDANAPFRLMGAGAVKSLLPYIPVDYNLPNAVMTALYLRFGHKVCFMDITFKPRVKGRNSINLRKIAGIGMKALRSFREIRDGLPGRETGIQEAGGAA